MTMLDEIADSAGRHKIIETTITLMTEWYDVIELRVFEDKLYAAIEAAIVLIR